MAAAVAARSEKAVENAGQDVSPRSAGGAVSDDESPYPEEARFFGVCPLRFIEDSASQAAPCCVRYEYAHCCRAVVVQS